MTIQPTGSQRPKRTNSDDALNKAVDCATVVRNKFTEGLDFASITDWTTELRPSMRKLRQAMDGLLKTARLTHSVFRVQEDRRTAQKACNVRYRRHVCFSQAVSSFTFLKYSYTFHIPSRHIQLHGITDLVNPLK